jgi:hypothetical protein
MTQYRMKKEKDFYHLDYALKNYDLMGLYIRPCFTNKKSKTEIYEKLTNKEFSFTQIKNSELTFFINNKPIIKFPLKWYNGGFLVEHLNERGSPAWNELYHPMDPGLPEVNSTLLRNDLDHMLVEIQFKGKIGLEYDGVMNSLDHYWKII